MALPFVTLGFDFVLFYFYDESRKFPFHLRLKLDFQVIFFYNVYLGVGVVGGGTMQLLLSAFITVPI